MANYVISVVTQAIIATSLAIQTKGSTTTKMRVEGGYDEADKEG